MTTASRTLHFTDDAATATTREAALQCFAQQLADSLAQERARHAATERALGKERKKCEALQLQKQSWVASHSKHLRLRDKYARLLSAVRDAVHRTALPAAVTSMASTPAAADDDGDATPPLAITYSCLAPTPALVCDADAALTTPTPMGTAHPSSTMRSAPPPPPAPRRAADRGGADRGSTDRGDADTVRAYDVDEHVADDVVRAIAARAVVAGPCPMRVAPSTPESYWRMGFSDDGEALGDDQPCGDDPFDAALAEYQAEQKCRAGTRGG